MKRLSLIKILCAVSLICIAFFAFTACGKTDGNSFTITAETSSYGVINISERAIKGQTVSFTAVPEKGYAVNAVYLNGVQLNSNSFTMPDSNVYLSAVYSANDGYEIITEDDEYGVISANPIVANAGDKVTLKTYVCRSEICRTVHVKIYRFIFIFYRQPELRPFVAAYV